MRMIIIMSKPKQRISFIFEPTVQRVFRIYRECYYFITDLCSLSPFFLTLKLYTCIFFFSKLLVNL